MFRSRYFWTALILFVAFALFSSLRSGVQAQPPAAGDYAPQARTPLAAGDVDTSISRVYVHVDKTGFGHEHGVASFLKSGHLNLGASQNAGELVFDMTSFNADTDEARRYVGLEGFERCRNPAGGQREHAWTRRARRAAIPDCHIQS